MAQLRIKKSNEPGKVPQPADLDWGELAINYNDGKLFYKQHGTGTVQLLNTDTNTVTRLRGTTSGTYTSGDLTLVAGTNITITQSGSDYTIASAGGVDPTKLPLAGGTVTGLVNFTYDAGSQGWSNIVIDASPAQNGSFIRANRASAATGEVGYAWGQGGVNQWINYLPTNSTTLQWYQGSAVVMSLTTAGTLNATNVTANNNQVLHAGNYNSYAPTLTGTGASGTWGISVTGSAASATTVSRGSGNIANVTAPGSGTYNQHVLYATNAEFGIEAALATDSLAGTRLPLVFSWRGGYDTLGGLKITGASSAQLGGNAILHAGNYNSYALALTGGTVTGALSITDDTQSSSTGTGSFITAGGVGIAKNLYVGNTIYITRAIEMSTSNNGLYHVGNNMTFDSPANDTFRIVNGRAAGAYPATLLFKSGFASNTYGAVVGGGGEIRLQTNRGDAFVSSATSTSIFDEVGGTRIVVSTGSQVQIYNNLTLMNTGSLVAGGTVQHTGLVMTAGTGVDQVYTHQQNITLTTGWQDTGVNAAELATGSYIVQVTSVDDWSVAGGHYSEYYTGIMSWYNDNTNSITTDEIPLHRAGHAPENGTIFLRIARTYSADPDNLKLQIAGTTNNNASYQYTFKFRRLI